MSDGRSSSEGKSWLSRLAEVWSDEISDRSELIEVIQDAAQRGVIDIESQRIIESTLKVSERQVREIMIPRAQMVALHDDDSIEEVIPVLFESRHSRFPVISAENADEIVGILFAKDLLRLVGKESPTTELDEFLRPAFFVPESTHLDKLIREFRSKKSHMAIVVNEYGGIAGLVTLEDALEQIIGEIDDEHDEADTEEELNIRELSAGVWQVKAHTPIAEFNEHFNSEFSNDDFDTMAGILLNAFERLPEQGESVTLKHWHFTILEADGRAIKLIQVELR